MIDFNFFGRWLANHFKTYIEVVGGAKMARSFHRQGLWTKIPRLPSLKKSNRGKIRLMFLALNYPQCRQHPCVFFRKCRFFIEKMLHNLRKEQMTTELNPSIPPGGWDLPADPAQCMVDFDRCRFPPGVPWC